MNDVEKLRARFLRAYANLPEPERYQVMAVVDEKTYSWSAAYEEITTGTKLGNKILEKMELVGIL